MTEIKTNIAIVGAGPVGLSAACFLQHAGIDFIIFDKKPKPTHTSNAILINMRTLQQLSPLGLSKPLIDLGMKLKGMNFYASKRLIASINLSHNLPYDDILTLPQAKTESILRTHLTDNDMTIHQNWALESVEQNKNKTMIRVNTPEGPTAISADYVLACDGSHSVVRKQAEISYPGKSLKSHFVMIDAKITSSEEGLNSFNGFFQPNLSFIIIPYQKDGLSRLLAEVSRHPKFNRIDNPTLENMQDIAKCCIPFKHEIKDMVWASKFWVHEHVAEKYKKDRVFLLGDAAHCHSPAGGLGMNTGIQDAANLCWKLALCLKNKAPSALLDTYEQERRPEGVRVVKLSENNTKIATINNKLLYHLRNTFMRIFLNRPAIANKFLSIANQLTICYPNNLITHKSHFHALRAGKQMPDFSLIRTNKTFRFYQNMNPNQFYLLCFGNTYQSSLISNLTHKNWPITILDAKNINHERRVMKWPKNGFVVIRPDAYIALASTDEKAVTHYFNTLFQ